MTRTGRSAPRWAVWISSSLGWYRHLFSRWRSLPSIQGKIRVALVRCFPQYGRVAPCRSSIRRFSVGRQPFCTFFWVYRIETFRTRILRRGSEVGSTCLCASRLVQAVLKYWLARRKGARSAAYDRFWIALLFGVVWFCNGREGSSSGDAGRWRTGGILDGFPFK